MGELTFRAAKAGLVLRLDVLYAHVAGAQAFGVRFPATNLLAFSIGGFARLGTEGRRLLPYGLAGVGVYNAQDALPLAPYRTRLGGHVGAGAALRLGRAALFAEMRFVHVTGSLSLDFLPIVAGVRWFP